MSKDREGSTVVSWSAARLTHLGLTGGGETERVEGSLLVPNRTAAGAISGAGQVAHLLQLAAARLQRGCIHGAAGALQLVLWQEEGK